MINLDSYLVEIKCPKCGFYNNAFIKQFRVEDVIICRGCKSNIQLIDHEKSVEKSKREIQRALNALVKKVEKIGKLTIRF
jgi:hypothetical protein